MRGDEIVGQAKYRSTHAVTIDAPAASVWPWLVQMGQGRGGLYSYDWLENLLGLKIHSAHEIDANLQALSVGDVVRLVPEGTQPHLGSSSPAWMHRPCSCWVPTPDRAAAFAAHLPYPCWTFQLTPAGAEPAGSSCASRPTSTQRPSDGWRTSTHYNPSTS